MDAVDVGVVIMDLVISKAIKFIVDVSIGRLTDNFIEVIELRFGSFV